MVRHGLSLLQHFFFFFFLHSHSFFGHGGQHADGHFNSKQTLRLLPSSPNISVASVFVRVFAFVRAFAFALVLVSVDTLVMV